MTRESSESNVTFVILGVIFSVVYGGIAVYVFCLSGLAGEFGESVWRDIAGIVVSITAMLALTYASLLVLTYRRPDRSEPGDPNAFEWHFLVPCRDEEAVIGETVSSARTSFPNCHVWVIDDASEDATAAIVRDLMDIDPNVHLVPRVAPNARLGKGKALNAAFRSVSDFVGGDAALRQRTIIGVLDADGYLSDNALELLAGPQGFGSDEHGAAQVEVWMKNRGDRRPRGDRGWYLNGLGRFLVRMQDIEFRTSNSAMQLRASRCWMRSKRRTVTRGGTSSVRTMNSASTSWRWASRTPTFGRPTCLRRRFPTSAACSRNAPVGRRGLWNARRTSEC
jgi:cellulose synthase/poly-beta-1,6-N-acetylglucosamine synthase-like glycosyltransferase